MTGSSYRKELSEETLPFDPESAQKIDPEQYWKNREAEQSHGFRRWVFWAGMVVLAVVAVIWGVVMFLGPPMYAPSAAFYVWGWRASLCSAVLIAVSLGLFRFAILCYGHHRHPARDSGDATPEKLAEAALKVAQKAMDH